MHEANDEPHVPLQARFMPRTRARGLQGKKVPAPNLSGAKRGPPPEAKNRAGDGAPRHPSGTPRPRLCRPPSSTRSTRTTPRRRPASVSCISANATPPAASWRITSIALARSNRRARDSAWCSGRATE
eukprot:43930-Chlamydomonas_euryale.AAC.1